MNKVYEKGLYKTENNFLVLTLILSFWVVSDEEENEEKEEEDEAVPAPRSLTEAIQHLICSPGADIL